MYSVAMTQALIQTMTDSVYIRHYEAHHGEEKIATITMLYNILEQNPLIMMLKKILIVMALRGRIHQLEKLMRIYFVAKAR